MGRVSREQAERNRKRVVQAACRLFRARGVENVSITDVMSEVGLTPGGFYKHFESKDALVNEAFELAFTQSVEAWEDFSSPVPAGVPDGLAALMVRYFKHRPLERTCPVLAFSSWAGNVAVDPRTRNAYCRGVEELYGQFRQTALEGPPESRTREELSDDAIRVLFAAMVGAGLLGRAMGENVFAQSLKMAVSGAGPRGPAGGRRSPGSNRS